MKKTALRILFSVCIVCMLIICIGVSAFADDTVKYTMKNGDTVLNVCNSLKIDFYANQAWISDVNNITNYSNIKVGKVLVLPTFNTSADPTRAIAAKANAGTAVATTTATTPTATGGAAVTTTTATMAGLKAGDTVVSYLINHKMAAGETAASVCNALGVDFDSNADTIKQLSQIDNWYRVPVGKNLIVPSLKAPAGSSYTAIVAHKVVGGETVGSICSSYGVDYGKTQAQLKALNSTDNLNVIRVGQTFYLPVPGTVTVTNTTQPAATSSTTTATTTAEAKPTTSSVKPNSSAHGTFVLTVNGKEVQTADSGQTVKVVATPAKDYKVGQISVTRTDTGAAVSVSNGSFVMPNAPVSVSVTFTK